jgi:nucleotide-binding universal stress UspA family protein
VRCAIKLARHFDSELTILHAFKRPTLLGAITGGSHSSNDFDQSRREAEQNLSALLKDVRAEHSKSDICFLSGRPSAQIVTMAKALDTDLIVISAHEYHRLQSLVSGSASEQIIRCAPCPVLVVRQSEPDFIPDAESEG